MRTPLFSNIIVHGCLRTWILFSSVCQSLGKAGYRLNTHIAKIRIFCKAGGQNEKVLGGQQVEWVTYLQ